MRTNKRKRQVAREGVGAKKAKKGSKQGEAINNRNSATTIDQIAVIPQVTKTPTAFKKKIPNEILIKIFRLAMPEPRIVTILAKTELLKRSEINTDLLKRRVGNAIRSGSEDERIYYTTCYTETPAIPTALLHTNLLARQIAREYYRPAFYAQLNGKAIFFDFKRDVLCFDFGPQSVAQDASGVIREPYYVIDAFMGHPSASVLPDIPRPIFKDYAYTSWADKLQNLICPYLCNRRIYQELGDLRSLECLVKDHAFSYWKDLTRDKAAMDNALRTFMTTYNMPGRYCKKRVEGRPQPVVTFVKEAAHRARIAAAN